jgi:TatA/E family protein of Tat protein translocase
MITSIPDLVIIGGVILLVFGPKRLPELAKSLGKGIRDFKKAMDGGYDEKEVLPPQSPHEQVAPPAAGEEKPKDPSKT